MDDFSAITAADTAVAVDDYNDQATLTLLGGDGEPNFDIVGTYSEIEDLLTEALHEIRAARKSIQR
jgi:hypothetical protein